MTYFQNITSLSELKKQYRELVKNNHPDKGGDTAVMQAINNEFEKLYNIWKDRKETADTTGYASDYEGATAKQYTQHVYEEYGWTGSRRDRYYSRKELKEIFAKWLKGTYKGCTFSIRLSDYNSIVINLLKADFNPFVDEMLYSYSLSRYDIHNDPKLNARAKEMFTNIQSFCQSYNYDHSDLYSDYYDVGFYFSMNIGTGKTPFKVEIPKSRRASGACAAEFKYKEGPAHQAIKKALGKHYFADVDGKMILCQKHYYNGKEFDSECYLYTNSNNLALKRLEALKNVGIICELTKRGVLQFVGYTPELEKALAEEDRAKEQAFKAWQEKQQKGKEQESESTQEQPKQEQNQTAEEIGAFTIVDYSEKAFAVVGDTREIKDTLKQHGGRLNSSLTVGGSKVAGWIFSKKSIDAVRNALRAFCTQEQPAEQLVQAERTEEQPAAEHNQQQPGQPEQAEPVNNSAAYGESEKSLIFPKLSLISTDVYSLYEINGVPFISYCKIRNDRVLKEGEIFNVYTDDEHKYGVEFDGESIETSILKALSFILKTECNEFGKALPKQFERLKGVNIVNDLLLLLDVLQELLTEQPKAEEKQPTPEDIAKVLEVFPALLDAVCEVLKADTQTEAHTETDTHQPHQEGRTPCNNAIYNAVCSSVILTGEYMAARREIKQAIKRYRFTLPQLKYMVYILETHPGINRERLKGAA